MESEALKRTATMTRICEEAGDRYYRTMTAWLVARCPGHGRDDCLRIALEYQGQLVALLANLELTSSSGLDDGRIHIYREYHRLVCRSIEALQETNATDEPSANPIIRPRSNERLIAR